MTARGEQPLHLGGPFGLAVLAVFAGLSGLIYFAGDAARAPAQQIAEPTPLTSGAVAEPFYTPANSTSPPTLAQVTTTEKPLPLAPVPAAPEKQAVEPPPATKPAVTPKPQPATSTTKTPAAPKPAPPVTIAKEPAPPKTPPVTVAKKPVTPKTPPSTTTAKPATPPTATAKTPPPVTVAKKPPAPKPQPPAEPAVQPAEKRTGGAEITYIVRIKGSEAADQIGDVFAKSPDEAKRAWSKLVSERPGLSGFRLVSVTGSQELILGYTVPAGQKPSFDEVTRVQKKLLAIDGVAYADPDSVAHPGKE